MGYLPHRSCKGAINAKLNPLRTKQQLHESAVGRRIAELFAQEEDEKISIEKLFERFNVQHCSVIDLYLELAKTNTIKSKDINPEYWFDLGKFAEYKAIDKLFKQIENN